MNIIQKPSRIFLLALSFFVLFGAGLATAEEREAIFHIEGMT